MDTSISQIAPILVGVGGLVTAIYTSYKSNQAQKNSQMVGNFQLLFDEQKVKVNELNEEIKRIKKDQTDERKQWAAERQRLQGRVDLLVEQNLKKDTKIAEMSGLIQVLQKKVE